MSRMPETVWLGEGDQYQMSHGMWDHRGTWGWGHQYIREDIHDAVVAELKTTKEQLADVYEAMTKLALGQITPGQLDNLLYGD